jgi:hypothetical protein
MLVERLEDSLQRVDMSACNPFTAYAPLHAETRCKPDIVIRSQREDNDGSRNRKKAILPTSNSRNIFGQV